GVVLGGLLWYYLEQGLRNECMLVFVTAVGSLSVSYVRARAEVERVQMYDGLFTRGVRVIVLAAGLVTGEVVYVLWLLAVMTIVTTVQRLYIAYQRLSRPGGPS
ncbi:MAG TPA: CDP-alcohol phosphatidyltransferase family protein, partial [Dehalococcoidia bacterium]